MNITALTIQNFMSIREAELSLNEKGLVLIRGVNHDDTSAKSNGAGKSSIPDAVSWCLFGVTARGETGDSIVNRTQGKNCAVAVSIQEDMVTAYTIARHRKHSKEKNRLVVTKHTPMGDQDLTLGTDKLTQELVEKIIGCSYEVFSTAIYAGQERMPNLPAMTDKQLKEIVEEAAGINMLRDCAELARTRALTLTRDHYALVSRESTLATSAADDDKMVEDAITEAEVFETRKAVAIATREQEVEEAKVTLDLSEQKVTKLKKHRDARLARLNEIRKQIASHAAEKTELARLDGELRTADRAATTAYTMYSNAAKEVRKHKDSIDTASARVGTNCTGCGKEIEANDLSHVLNACKESLGSAAKAFKDAKAKHEAAEHARTEAQTKRDSYAASMTDLTALSVEADTLTSDVRKIDQAIANEATHEKSLKTAEANLERVRSEENPHTATIERLKKLAGTRKAELEAIRDKLKDTKEQMDIAEQVVDVYSPTGVRGAILDAVTPYLNARTSHYLSILSDGNITAVWNTLSRTAKGEIKEKFNIEVSNSQGGDCFGLLSGGEKRKVRLSCALAMQDLVASRASKPIRLFVADEIDDAVDEAGLERLMTILDEKARERGTVLVISHHSLDDWIRDSATVEKSGGQSTVSGALDI